MSAALAMIVLFPGNRPLKARARGLFPGNNTIKHIDNTNSSRVVAVLGLSASHATGRDSRAYHLVTRDLDSLFRDQRN
ncbi:hypothetical protein F4553_005142 [Allocatelliglobosispora scoriae]|uniref:Uncharacterized protein n=1 Tax=Allocatelliglobosispora scoriae TaxID=643052 RepID=A0A841BXV8_9ACTN|nr:hypothetical protein [Allocatelliglobosispora scoriae]